jgi:hypothetical protein
VYISLPFSSRRASRLISVRFIVFLSLACFLVLSVSRHPRLLLWNRCPRRLSPSVSPSYPFLPLAFSFGQENSSILAASSIVTIVTSRVLITLTREGKTVTDCQTLTRTPRAYLVMVANWERATISKCGASPTPGRDRNNVF